MLARIRDRNIHLVYLAVLLLGTAYGVAIAVTTLFLDARGFGKLEIGQLATFFAAGLVLASLPVGALLRRFSAKATLTASLLGYAATIGLFTHLQAFASIAVARLFDGAFSVGIWVSCETILLMRSDEDNKAYVTSLYAVAIAVGYVVGPLVAGPIARALSIDAAFVVAAIIAVLAAAVVVVGLDRDPPGAHEAGPGAPEASGVRGYRDPAGAPEAVPAAGARRSVFWLLGRIKNSCFAAFAYGYFQASVVLFLPLYLIETKGIARDTTILVPAFFAAGMLLFSNAAGRLGDRLGHLLVMRILGAIGLTMILGFVYLRTFPPMAAAVFVAGATLASISPVSLAFQGVVTPKHDYSRANSIYNFFYASGIFLGPLTSSVIFDRLGGAAMLYHLAALWAAFVVFSMVFAADDPARGRREAEAEADLAA